VASPVADIFRQAAQLNREDPQRKGNLVEIDSGRPVIVSGDIHGHRPNLVKIIDHANLPAHPEVVLVLQEIVHGRPDAGSGRDRSVELLMRCARLKISHPRNVLFLMGNHDIAQLTGNEITKDGQGVCKAFVEGVNHAFGADAPEVLPAIDEFLNSLPLAIRCASAMLAHSLPSPARMKAFSMDILSKTGYGPEDFKRGGAVYEWTWGRGQTPEQLDSLAADLGVGFFVLGHRHCSEGYELIPNRGISLASDNENGQVMEFDSGAELTLNGAAECLKTIRTLTKG
jgi:hypothetical protein